MPLVDFLLYMAELGCPWLLLHAGTEHTSLHSYLACSSSQHAAIQYLIPVFSTFLRYMLTGMYSTCYGDTSVCALNS